MKRKRKSVVDASFRGEVMRVQKILSRAGIASRRKAEQLILEGRITINKKIITKLGFKADPAVDEVSLDNIPVHFPKYVYYLLNKPVGLKCVHPGPREAITKTIWSLLPGDKTLVSAGRLDRQSQGLLIITNDGDFANMITHPSYKVEKSYEIIVRGRLTTVKIRKLEAGVWLDDGRMRLSKIKVKKKNPDSSVIEIKLQNRPTDQLRKVFAKIGHPVSRITRTGIGIFKIGGLKPGEYVKLNLEDIQAFRDSITGKSKKRKVSKEKKVESATRNLTKSKKGKPASKRKTKAKPARIKPADDIEFIV